MAMTNEKFDEMVGRLEILAKNAPGKYRFRVALLALLGYAYIMLVVAVLFAIFAVIIGLSWKFGKLNFWVWKFGWVLIALAWVVIRSLWVKQPPPEGFELTRAEAPRLFDLIEEVTRALDAPRIHHVLVLDFFNAAVVQVPRFGFFGGYRNYLLLGLPDMQAASPAQFRATLAHELGHLSGNHGRFSGWIYRLRQTWGQLLMRLESEQRWGSFFFTTFFNWYAPYFQAYSFVLARTHEYEADEAAARLTGAENVAEMLIDTRLKGSYLEEKYWPEVYRHAETDPRPVAGVYANLPQTLCQPLPPETVARQLNLALSERTISDDTHPALADRLRALGYPAQNGLVNADWAQRYQPAPVAESAADFYLGEQAQTLIAQFDRAWQEGIAEQWSERHNYVRRTRQTLDALEEKARGGTLLFDEAWERASLATELRTPEEAIPLLREVLAQRADHAPANFLLGQLLLRQNDPAGVAHLEQASARDPDMLIPACQVLFIHFTAAGQPQEAERYRQQAQKYVAKLEEAEPERSNINSADELIPHQAAPAEVERLRGQLSPFPQIKTAYLAQKKLEKFPDKPLYVLGLVANAPWYQLDRTALNRQLINEVVSQVAFMGETLVVVLDGEHKKLLKGFRQIEGAQIFP
ncbi:MAG TPA: M48 family metalloprotease [Pyrinomonadaceae bacterium]|jgi:Zn-dependent protease with chaperone function